MMSTASFPIAVALLVAALLAGCGGSSAGGVTRTAFHRALSAAACMRANGVPDYPKPKLVNATIRVAFTTSVNPETPAVQEAAKQCGYEAEQQAGETSSRIVFVRCMRAHGVKHFPYPTTTGHVSPAMVKAAGININSAAVAPLVSECLPSWLLPGKAP
jgi:hypothetical protein